MCKLIWNKKEKFGIDCGTKLNWLILASFSGALLMLSSFVQALEVGEAIAIEGVADYRTDYLDDDMQLEIIEQDMDIEVMYLLQTRPDDSKVQLLLEHGHIYTIGENSHVSVLKPIDNTISFALKRGIIRAVTSSLKKGVSCVVAVTSSTGSIRFVTTTEGGIAKALCSGYIVSCGPPVTPRQDTCMFVGLYGQSEAKSFAYPSQTVILERQFYTFVQKGKPPSPNPPQKLSDQQFQELINKTTIVGTGSSSDRLEITAIDELTLPYPSPPIRPQTEPQAKIPDVPLAEFEPLPLPPLPPL